MPKKFDVFISYASKDKSKARKIADALTNRGERVWFDEKELRAGDDWDQHIEKSLSSSKVILLLLSGSSLRSQWTNYEMGLALGRESDTDTRVVPILLDSIDPSLLPAPIRNRNLLKLGDSKRSLEAVVEQVVNESSRGSATEG